MNIDTLQPSPSRNQCAFRLNQYGKVPAISGCYVLATFEGHILYIGQAINLRRRFEQHLDDSEKTGLTSEGRAIWFYWLEAEEGKLNPLERGWVQANQNQDGKFPILNKISPPT